MTILIWAANICGWPIIHIVIAKGVLSMPLDRFSSDGPLYQARSWEHGGIFYRRWLAIRAWKSMLPDGAPWFGGFSKKRIASRDRAYLNTFVQETRRAEFAHWCMLACLPVFFLWNPPWACWVMTAYAIGANIPCIVVQRYNRLTLLRLLFGGDRRFGAHACFTR